ncbi:hypothetical protein [Rugamonas aquatica]|uniref:Uncharacterized protein n=1 Tax=Rugamonas aquatica TaxID=2743357 RepID=A0A6A7N7M0_9BURK|nr:hypothetical protein [Rugamonas aquatica]MQA40737.1 hypothetical protein [Rugamonas aquatica]
MSEYRSAAIAEGLMKESAAALAESASMLERHEALHKALGLDRASLERALGVMPQEKRDQLLRIRDIFLSREPRVSPKGNGALQARRAQLLHKML